MVKKTAKQFQHLFSMTLDKMRKICSHVVICENTNSLSVTPLPNLNLYISLITTKFFLQHGVYVVNNRATFVDHCYPCL